MIARAHPIPSKKKGDMHTKCAHLNIQQHFLKAGMHTEGIHLNIQHLFLKKMVWMPRAFTSISNAPSVGWGGEGKAQDRTTKKVVFANSPKKLDPEDFADSENVTAAPVSGLYFVVWTIDYYK